MATDPVIHGPQRCAPPAPCIQCDDGKRPGGPHHWLPESLDADDALGIDDGAEHLAEPERFRQAVREAGAEYGCLNYAACKHCGAWSTDDRLIFGEDDLDDDEEDYDDAG